MFGGYNVVNTAAYLVERVFIDQHCNITAHQSPPSIIVAVVIYFAQNSDRNKIKCVITLSRQTAVLERKTRENFF